MIKVKYCQNNSILLAINSRRDKKSNKRFQCRRGLRLEISVNRRIEGFTADELFQIAANVEAYPKFLPFCIAARVLKDTPEQVGHDQKVDNVFGVGPFRSRFITHALLEEPNRIHISSDDPQFEILSITWAFQQEDEGACLVSFNMKQTFKSEMKTRLARSVAKNLEKKLIEKFETQARKVFNRPRP